MSLNDLLGKGAVPTKIGPSLILDCVLRESHDMTNRVTAFPVEEGAVITDHILSSPREVQIEGLITNSPVTVLGGRLDRQSRGTIQDGKITGRSINRAELAFKELERMHSSGELVTITGRFKAYENMAMLSSPVTRDPMDGDSIRFSASFREIRKVSLKTASFNMSAYTKKEKAQPKKKTGKDKGSETKDPVKARTSIIKALFNTAKSAIKGG